MEEDHIPLSEPTADRDNLAMAHTPRRTPMQQALITAGMQSPTERAARSWQGLTRRFQSRTVQYNKRFPADAEVGADTKDCPRCSSTKMQRVTLAAWGLADYCDKCRFAIPLPNEGEGGEEPQ